MYTETSAHGVNEQLTSILPERRGELTTDKAHVNSERRSPEDFNCRVHLPAVVTLNDLSLRTGGAQT